MGKTQSTPPRLDLPIITVRIRCDVLTRWAGDKAGGLAASTLWGEAAASVRRMCARLRIATRWSLFRVKCPFAVRGACQVRGEYIETLSISPSRPRPHSSQAPGGPGTNLFQYFPATWGRLLPLFPQSSPSQKRVRRSDLGGQRKAAGMGRMPGSGLKMENAVIPARHHPSQPPPPAPPGRFPQSLRYHLRYFI